MSSENHPVQGAAQPMDVDTFLTTRYVLVDEIGKTGDPVLAARPGPHPL